ncbi:N-6 DNA methylase [Tessaracoccus sp. ZS01]|uniref:Eco57I restriction-modification methylase domain-containing protein n=1 Tax=Tessaracoccus sp. ZS01 TaxID=1906324 RepID=UPI00096DADEA|nr:N-6 DNA methylase [Tessaracoccus sp. ZS01]MCG6568147.1 restriction endonuclease [Tessaracoccus sp. ZS01]OMG54070.1 restriction endonuclease [Tessaracoccus sp. ZS01]
MAAESFVGLRVQGGLLPAELLSRIAAGALDGQTSSDYHLAPGETFREAANRAWAYLTGVWAAYRQAAERLPESDRGTTLTRERWLLILLRELGFGRVSAAPSGGLHIDGKHAPVSHLWEHVPMHLLGHRVDLDRRTQGVAGAATSSPQSMVQELLNRSDEHLWAVLSNGLTLRLLRDSTSLVGSAYVEFDLEAIFDGDLFADFLLLFSLCHESRLQVRDDEKGAASCWLETWRTSSIESGSRALDHLRDGVIDAITTLGTGFLAHPANAQLRDQLADSHLRIEDVNHALLRMVYRLLFTFVAEDRGLLLSPDADPSARSRYANYFSTARLRRTARRRRGTRHTDQWRALNVVWDGLGSETGRPELGLVGIGGVFDSGPLDIFRSAELSNEALLRAVRHLSLVEEPGSKIKRVVDYRNLGAEELGSIYETLLEFVPSWDAGSRAFSLLTAAGNDRKSTGSYYTPTSLIDCLLDSALDPVLDRAEKSSDPEQALLSLTVCDPACGSGHFLVAAARRIAKRVAAIRTGDPEPPPERVREALSDVVGRCIYGVDVNPLAAELAKVSLWLETLDPGRPLAFLDAQVKVGNSLMGTTPALIAAGIPDEAFAVLEGDDKKTVTALKKQNKVERSGQDELFGSSVPTVDAALARQVEGLLGSVSSASLAAVHARQQRLRALEADPAMRRARLVADAWCSAFVWPKHAGGPKAVTDGVVKSLERGESLTADTAATVQELATEYKFFHWHVEFPHLFRPSSDADGPGWDGGFDVVLGNPPWEHVELKEQEFFAIRDPDIANASGARRKRMIKDLPANAPGLAAEFENAKRHLDCTRHFLANSGRFPLCGRGRVKTDTVFAELGRSLLASHGRFGFVLPTGIATDATTQYFFKDLVQSASIVSLYDFENRKPLFVGVDSRFKFCLLTLAGRSDPVERAEFAFFAHDPSDLLKEDARFELTPEEIQLLNPNTGTCPIFRTRRDAEITLSIYRRVPVLINENDPVNGNPWGISFMQGLFNMTSDSHLFHTREELEADGWTLNGNVFERPLAAAERERERERENNSAGVERMMPLYEAKMLHLYDTRWATYDQNGSIRAMTEDEKAQHASPLPRYWVAENEIDRKLAGRWENQWFLGWRDICRATDARTVIATASPRVGYGDKWLLALPSRGRRQTLQATWSSFALDYCARQKIGGTSMKFFSFMQLPVPRPENFESPSMPDRSASRWISPRVDRLNGWIADPDERAQVRAELDALMFHVYGIGRDDVSYVLDTFPIVKRKDEAAFGSYRTQDLILKAYDALAHAETSGTPYRAPWTQEVSS